MTEQRTFTCEACGQTFDQGWTDEEANAEARANFGVEQASEDPTMAEVCVDCFRSMVEVRPLPIAPEDAGMLAFRAALERQVLDSLLFGSPIIGSPADIHVHQSRELYDRLSPAFAKAVEETARQHRADIPEGLRLPVTSSTLLGFPAVLFRAVWDEKSIRQMRKRHWSARYRRRYHRGRR